MNIETTSTQQLITLAKQRAAADTEHSYTKVPDFEPHTWVWLAMRDAYNAGIADATAATPAQPVEAVDARSIEHDFPNGLKLGTATRFLTVHRDGKWGWEAEFSQGQAYGYPSRWRALMGAVNAALAHPRPTGDVQSRNLFSDLRAFVMLLDELADDWCAEEGETFQPAYELRSQVAAFVTLQPDSRRSRIGRVAAPTGEQAGEVVVREPCKLCFGRGERTADGSNGRRVRCKNCDGTGQISRHAQPHPMGVLGEVHAERQRQDAKWGQQNHPSFTGVDLVTSNAWISKRECDRAFKNGSGSYAHILAEEVAEAFDERDDTDEAKLRTELIQVAAVAVAWVECIDRRTAAPEVPRG